MPKTYSIAEAKSLLGRVVDEAESQEPIQLTRRGRPVAMVVSLADYRKLTAPRRNLWETICAFRSQHDMADLDIDTNEIFSDVRDPSPGKEFSW